MVFRKLFMIMDGFKHNEIGNYDNLFCVNPFKLK